MALNSKKTGRLNHSVQVNQRKSISASQSAQVNQCISTAMQAPINEDLIV